MTRPDLDVFEAATVEVCAQERGDLLGCEIGHKTKVDLCARDRGQDGLRTGAGVARDHPADRARRLQEVFLLELVAFEVAHESRDPVDAQHAALVEWESFQELSIGGGRRSYTLHETVDGDLVARVLERRERPDQPPGRVRDDRPERGMSVLARSADAKLDGGEALQPTGGRRPARGR